MGPSVRRPSQVLRNAVFLKTIDDILLNPSAHIGWVWLFAFRKLVLNSTNADGLSVLNRLRLLLTGDLPMV